MQWFKNRTVLGIGCIALSLLICFGLTPLFHQALRAQTEIVRVTRDIEKGEQITREKLEVVQVGAYNLPSHVMTSLDSVAGQYATAALQKGDYILSTKLSAVPLAEFAYLNHLDGSKQAISISIKSFAAGLSGKLQAGDIITLIASDYGEMRTTTMPPELQYVEVLAVTTSSGMDKDAQSTQKKSDDDKQQLPSTLTLLVQPIQAQLLADMEVKGQLHAALVYRGDQATAQDFIAKQDDYLAKKSNPDPDKEANDE
ncbi:Flp pilus assembly protein CpaB [Paenibacillus sp. MSJ-34]|uniref:Flp pilus assembly protein CpaB n=1 Tax=Paenibacillus sp. MSJ-34 TaxID=2841529 RepID=UPI001C118AFF|nr:Flp pilus assembly protein CpaB [Paenibacillus sp. MSJ-34]MBU5445241.1 Flp pilus assembly protein CpaB [Paenibacillus sp. MSJ-34]